jgi:dienelactone hydrolase
MRIACTIGQIAAGAVLVICLLVLIGAQLYGLPFISPIGATVLSVFGPWFIAVPIAIGALEIWVRRRSHSRGALVLMSMAVAAAGWASVALARMVAEFHAHGVPINLVRAWDTTTSQVACAMAWTAANAVRLGGDPARISLLGSSAGGNLAINAAYLANAGRLESSCGGTVPRVSAVSALYPPVDLAAAWVSRVPAISDMARRFNRYYVGGGPEQFPDRYRFVASATHINPAAPPTLVIFGANDHLVPPDATDRFAVQARKAGIDMESIAFPYGDHAFNLNQYGMGNQFYLGMTYRFLSEHGQRPANSRPE